MTLTSSAQRANRAALVAALRSGRYAQTKRNLASGPADAPYCFCVLGLACHLSGLGHWEPYLEGELFFVRGTFRNLGVPPIVVEEYYGFTQMQVEDLICQNDKGTSFASLADFIEALPPPSDDEEET